MRNNRFSMIARAGESFRRLRLERWTIVTVAAAFIVAAAIVLVTTQLPSLALRGRTALLDAGSIAERDYVVERDFRYVDEEATRVRRDAREKLVPPVFALNALVSSGAMDDFERFSQAFLRHVKLGSSGEQIYLAMQVDFPERFSRADIRLLMTYRGIAQAFEDARDLLEVALAHGIADIIAHGDESLNAGAIEVRRMQDGRMQSEEIPLDQVTTMENIADQTEARAQQRSYGDAERRVVLILVRAFAVNNAFYDAETTLLRRNRARAEVEPVTEKLSRGEVLVRAGDLISESTAQKIRALREYAKTIDSNEVTGSVLFLLIAFAVALYLLSIRSAGAPLRRGQVFLLVGMGLGHLAISALVVRFGVLPDWVPVSVAIPTSAMAMLVAILVSTPVGVYFSLIVSLALLLLTNFNVQGFLFAFLSGIAATAVVLKAEKRIDLVRAGLLLSLADLLILSIVGLLANYETRMFLSLLGWGVANGFLCGILTLGFLPILELLLNAPTRFKLMELSDLNSPIFKRMLSQAPGTYTHSISVANMAETACEAIGANALLARVSAYYHDIGKVDQADYFVENQKAFNRHDELKPSLSVAVIKSHVRIGIEKARELNLPQAIIDIIAQHHGRGLITYFYDRAVKEGKTPRVSRDDYSYPGVRPKTKEAAVLMLADTVEAASRTLKRPTEARLESFVHDMIMEKLNSGELGDSILTLRDLELIRKSFVLILEGYFHTRIEYPRLARLPDAVSARRASGGDADGKTRKARR
jgi:putative nucleotidyltransferase with HDIG domain